MEKPTKLDEYVSMEQCPKCKGIGHDVLVNSDNEIYLHLELNICPKCKGEKSVPVFNKEYKVK